jgi:phosphatidylglycerophosphatase A
MRTLYSCFGLGYAPVASGTFGTLLGIPIYFLLIKVWDADWRVYALGTLIVFFVGWWASAYGEVDLNTHDSKKVVIDEVLGYLVTMFPLPLIVMDTLPQPWIWGFFLFRFYDIWKPGPAGYVDRNTPGGFGVMLDDAIAGVFAWVTMLLLSLIWSHIFV